MSLDRGQRYRWATIVLVCSSVIFTCCNKGLEKPRKKKQLEPEKEGTTRSPETAEEIGQLEEIEQCRRAPAFSIDSLHTSLSGLPMQFPWDTVHCLALLSRLAYATDEHVRQRTTEWGFSSVEFVRANSMVAFVASSNQVMVVVFRGTDDLYDWFVNLDFKADLRPPKIHRGFRKAYAALKKKLLAAIKQQCKSNQPIWVTGHSLGGALAMVFLLDIRHEKDLEVAGGVTYGQPMVIAERRAKIFCDSYRGRYIRLVNQRDLVPRVPPRFEHVGDLVWFVDDKLTKFALREDRFGIAADKNDSPEPLKPLSEKEFEALKKEIKSNIQARDKGAVQPEGKGVFGGAIPGLQEHSIDEYVKRIEKELGSSR